MKAKHILLGGGTGMKVLLIMLALLLFLLLTSAQATTYYVDKNCTHGCNNSDNKCLGSEWLDNPFVTGTSWEAPWCAIGSALYKADDGDTIIVAPGNYFEHVSIGKNITLRSEAGPENTAIREAFSYDPGKVAVSPQVNAEIDGFTIAGSNEACTQWEPGGNVRTWDITRGNHLIHLKGRESMLETEAV